MKHLILSFFLFFTFSVFAQNNLNFYVGTFTTGDSEGIYLCNLNTETGQIQLENTFKGIDNPSFLSVSPDRKFLYVVSRVEAQVEKTGGFVQAYRIETDISLSFLNKQISNGAGPCHVSVSNDGKYVAIATYTGGTLSLYPVDKDGKLEPASSVIVNKGASINKDRQNEPHAHSIKFSPYNNQVFAADLGTDQLDIFVLQNGKLETGTQKFAPLEAGAGPRHFEFHPEKEIIYVINELNSTVTSLEQQNGNWENKQSISTVPEGFEGINYCADIHISKDGRFLYGSNRGHNSIVVYSVDKDGKLTFVKTVPVEGDWPRNFGISPDGTFLLVANQNSSNITVFKINPESGIPEYTGNEIEIPNPVCIDFF